MCDKNSEVNGPNTKLMLFWTLIVLVACKLWAPKSTQKYFGYVWFYRIRIELESKFYRIGIL